jgi:hypothetical protein
MFKPRIEIISMSFAAAVALAMLSACKSGNYSPLPSTAQAPAAQQFDAQQSIEEPSDTSPNASILKQLKKQVVIGSTIDPVNGAENPYGLTVAPVTAGALTKGDLVICDFNGKSNVQGTGRSILALHPDPGSKPMHVSDIKEIHGCDALALDVDDTIWAAVMVANGNPVLDPSGKLISNISGKPFDQPWGQVLGRHNGTSYFYESNAGTGTIVRIKVGSKFTWQVIATGFPVNHGKPGTALAPSGLSYDDKIDTLYFADGMNNTIVAFKDVSTIPKDGIKAVHNGMDFDGPASHDARVVYAGKPLNGPISTALLPNGNIIAGNTLDPNGKNLIIEISAGGKLLDVLNVDNGALGALFGLAVTGSKLSDIKVYFNDDNVNKVEMLEQ